MDLKHNVNIKCVKKRFLNISTDMNSIIQLSTYICSYNIYDSIIIRCTYK